MPSKATPLTADEIEARFRENYPVYQYHLVEFMTEHLSDVSRSFGGDLQEMLVLAIIGQVHLRAHIDVQHSSAGLSGLPATQPLISASRIADASGIPRETVRRKLMKLAERGWVEKDPEGSWRLAMSQTTARAKEGLSELDSRGIARVAGLHARLQALLK